MGIPFQPKLHHQATEIQPFSFESRDKLKAAEKAEKIKQVHKEDKKVRMMQFQRRGLNNACRKFALNVVLALDCPIKWLMSAMGKSKE